ncbi:hypothetical protein BJ878DRAFT_418221 [Calycina marina]|uniref:BZIP domain-containing protein n=1 Tax=Calycina marina TaxID=1763456 RepID=A0A9P8CGM9_9HELO|nr:hypothetical protein BJ878DRAFT_418221 [Calycina marina]
MSQRSSASRPASQSSPEGQRITLPPLQPRDDHSHVEQRDKGAEQEQRESKRYTALQASSQHGRVFQSGAPQEPWRSAPSTRDLGVQSILNPMEPERTQIFHLSARRRDTSDLTQSTPGAHPYLAPSPSTSTTNTFPGQSGSSNTSPIQETNRTSLPTGRGSPPRHVMTPKGLRTTSLRGPSQGTINAQRTQFVPDRSRRYTSGLSQYGPSAAHPLATPPERPPQSQYGFPPTEPSLSQERQISAGGMQAPSRASPSRSTSPSLSTASVGVSSSQASPASFLYKGGPTSNSGSYFPGSNFASSIHQSQGGGGVQFQAPTASVTEGPYSAAPPPSAFIGTSATSSRQGSDPTQFLAFPTSEGHSFYVPVDVHQASKLADEKRARNAGASARFRQRRKEKEKEASSTIEKMQQTTREQERRMREMESERDFYRGERDRLRDVLYRTPGMRDFAIQGPPSPRQSRSTTFPGQIGQTAPPMSYQSDTSANERAARRRRTDPSGKYVPVPYSHPPTPHATYPPGPGSTNLPPLRMMDSTVTLPSPTGGPPPAFDPSSRPNERPWPADGPPRR